jgi:hypothetical protein
MNKTTSMGAGSYIVRDKRGHYMSGYSQKLGETNARAWARNCAKRSKGILYLRKGEGQSEEELENYIPAKVQ